MSTEHNNSSDAEADKAEQLLSITVQAEDSGMRLDRLVAKAASVSRRVARTWIAAGRVRLGGRVVRALSREIREGRKLQILTGGEAVKEQGPAEPGVLHLDRWLLGVDKPSGLLSQHDRHGAPSVESEAVKLLESRGERPRLWLAHRLDAPTSGVLLLARTPQATKHLGEVFREGKANKVYLALCQGRLESRREVNAPIARIQGTKHGVAKRGKPAATLFEPLIVGDTMTLVLARPRTGRTHQIRVHLASIGHPIAGDAMYGGPRYTDDVPPVAIGRCMLHAAKLTVPHPDTGLPLTLEAPVPQDMRDIAGAYGVWDPSLVV